MLVHIAAALFILWFVLNLIGEKGREILVVAICAVLCAAPILILIAIRLSIP